jgi:L-asparaginase
VQGVVLECYGAGNAPSRNRELMAALADATARGVVIVAVTQVRRGSARLDLYKTGRALLDVGVVSGIDMTPEAALAKLYYLFDRGHPPEEVRALMQQDLRGELGPGSGERR